MLRLATKVTSSPTISLAQRVGHGGDRPHLGPSGGKQGDDLVLAHLLAEGHAGQDIAHCAARRGQRDDRRGRRGGGVARGTAGAAESGGGNSLPEHQEVVPAQSLRVGHVEDRKSASAGQPPVGLKGKFRIQRQTGGERVAGRLGRGARGCSRAGQARSGLT